MNQWMKCKKEIQIYVSDKKTKRKDIFLKDFFVLWSGTDKYMRRTGAIYLIMNEKSKIHLRNYEPLSCGYVWK